MESLSIDPVVTIHPNAPETPTSREWRSCCFSINTSATKYFVQVTVLASLIVFSAVMLVMVPECESQRNYSSLLLFCLGILTPTPKM